MPDRMLYGFCLMVLSAFAVAFGLMTGAMHPLMVVYVGIFTFAAGYCFGRMHDEENRIERGETWPNSK